MFFEIVGRHIDFGLAKIASIFLQFVFAIYHRFSAGLVEHRKRDEIAKLLELEDNQLSDIGISRDDVTAALMKPLDFNSGRYLENIRRNKKMAD